MAYDHSWHRAVGHQVLDVGAAHPIVLSNTYLLHKASGTGLLVEPDPAQASLLRKFRQKDTVLNVGVAFDDRRAAVLRRFSTPWYNTFVADRADGLLARFAHITPAFRQTAVEAVEIALVPINDLIKEHFRGRAPHFISIDAEGVDFAILESLDLASFGPLVLCVEASRPLEDFNKLLSPHGYALIMASPDNFIFSRDVDKHQQRIEATWIAAPQAMGASQSAGTS